jgi:hypothetical protein
MMKKAYVAAGVALALSGAVLADTPIGPGVTGSGGTGANAADANVRPGAGGQGMKTREDGMPMDRADVKVRGDVRAKDSSAAAATGSTSGGSATGTTGGLGTLSSPDGVQPDPKAAMDP